jgi:hypothetical protein
VSWASDARQKALEAQLLALCATARSYRRLRSYCRAATPQEFDAALDRLSKRPGYPRLVRKGPKWTTVELPPAGSSPLSVAVSNNNGPTVSRKLAWRPSTGASGWLTYAIDKPNQTSPDRRQRPLFPAQRKPREASTEIALRLRGLLVYSDGELWTWLELVHDCAVEEHAELDDVLGQSRQKVADRARARAWAELRAKGFRWQEIADAFGRRHSTVVEAVQAHQARRRKAAAAG